MICKLLAGALAVVAMSYAAGPPALPFVDGHACPFEGCTYREWTAQEQISVYDTWQESREPIAKLSKGDAVTGITGLVMTIRPGLIRMNRDFPEQNLKAGEEILTYAYRGEGVSAVWVHGQYQPDFDISFAKRPDGTGCGNSHCAATYVDLGEKIWWAEIRLKTGRRGWVNMNTAKFDGTDQLALLLNRRVAV